MDGDLTLSRVGDTFQLKLGARDDFQHKAIIPILYYAELSGTQHENCAGYEQEWSVMVLST